MLLIIQMLTLIHNDTDDASNAGNYNRVIGIAPLKAFSCGNKKTNKLQLYLPCCNHLYASYKYAPQM